MSFYRNAIIAFALQLVILLAIVAMIMANLNKSQEFPASISECPDYFSMAANGDCIMDQVVYNSGTVEGTDCTKYKLTERKDKTHADHKRWAIKCGVAWDGITNSTSVQGDILKKCLGACPTPAAP
jgi:hypothetical protein